MQLTTLINGMSEADFFTALNNNIQYSRFNNCDFDLVTSSMPGTEIVSKINGNFTANKVKYKFSPETTDLSVGMSGADLIAYLNQNYINLDNTLKLKTIKPMFTLKSDDGSNADLIDGLPYCATNNITGCTYMLYENIDQGGGYLSTASMQTMDAGGWEFGSHGTLAWGTGGFDPDEEADLLTSRNAIEAVIGSGKCKTFSIHGAWDDLVGDYAKRYFEADLSNGGEGFSNLNGTNIDPFNILSMMIGQNGGFIDISTELGRERMYQAFDIIAENNGWFIAIIHGWSDAVQDLMDEWLEYCEEKGIDVVSVAEGLDSLIMR